MKELEKESVISSGVWFYQELSSVARSVVSDSATRWTAARQADFKKYFVWENTNISLIVYYLLSCK